MLNFDDEIQKFQPILELEGVGNFIQNTDLSDISDILVETIKKAGGTKIVRKQ